MKKKMTLNKTWKECLRMWKWIVKQTGNNVYESSFVVDSLKYRWLKEHGYKPSTICCFCFFCEITADGAGYHCTKCPGVKVSRYFRCTNLTYFWAKYPAKFYKKLLQLDAKRKNKN